MRNAEFERTNGGSEKFILQFQIALSLDIFTGLEPKGILYENSVESPRIHLLYSSAPRSLVLGCCTVIEAISENGFFSFKLRVETDPYIFYFTTLARLNGFNSVSESIQKMKYLESHRYIGVENEVAHLLK